jgi:predicted amidohydrolase
MALNHFTVTLCCPPPRVGFGVSDHPVPDELDELRRFMEQPGDILVLPEGFLKTENLAKAEQLAAQHHKWLICGTESPEHALAAVAISPQQGLVHFHQKTTLTDQDIQDNRPPGQTIEPFDLPFCPAGTPLCYEIHFPEVSRILALKGARILFNPIGTGMWHSQQLAEWTAIARARAIENGVFVVGCTHFCDPIPLAYAYAPDGAELACMLQTNSAVTVDIDLARLPAQDWLRHRTPALYGALARPVISQT